MANARQDVKWGWPNSGLAFDNLHRRVSILTEECGEVAHAVLEGDHENLKDELVQVCSRLRCVAAKHHGVRAMNRAERRRLGHRGPWEGDVDGGQRTDVKYGVCNGCGHRKLLWLPSALCEKDLLKAAEEFDLMFNADAFGGVEGDALPAEVPFDKELALAELERMEAEL